MKINMTAASKLQNPFINERLAGGLRIKEQGEAGGQNHQPKLSAGLRINGRTQAEAAPLEAQTLAVAGETAPPPNHR